MRRCLVSWLAPCWARATSTHSAARSGPSAVLVGDAAHSMWPTLGHAVNSALEDAAVPSRILKSCRVSHEGEDTTWCTVMKQQGQAGPLAKPHKLSSLC
jgi:2-polyprenyl-6-methoxyphenol hydroxylase-like FAD-dependent oxidoreductase